MSRSPTKSLGRRLLEYALPYRRLMGYALICILLMTLAIGALPVIIRHAIDGCLIDQTRPVAERMHDLGRLTVLFVFLAAFGHLIRYGQSLLTAWIGQKIIYDLRMSVFRKIMNLHQAYFDRTAVGQLMSRVTSDIERLQNFVTEGVVGTIADLFMLAGIMGFMIYISPRMAFVLFAILPPLFALLFFVNGRLREANRNIRKRNSDVSEILQEDLGGMSTIQLFNREAAAISGFDHKNRDLRSAHFEEVRWFSFYFPVLETGQSISIMLIIATCGLLLLNDHPAMTLGILGAFLTYVRDFFRPLGSLSEKAGAFQTALASAERVFELLDTEEAVRNIEEPKPFSAGEGVIRFENVWFAYIDENWVIKDLSFEVQPGLVVAAVGATGAGKSTIINLVGRFYDVQRGRITIDGIDIRELDKFELRKKLGYVFQDPFLFAGTVAENIALHNPALTRIQIEQAAATVNAHQFITAMSGGYDTVLNERGEGLSLGQKQLIVMARALAQDPELLFIMDEATASVDTGTEQLIQDALAHLMKNRTSIVIAHRLSTIRHADLILVMKHGELIDSGTHEQLMTNDGYYRHLYELMQHQP
jgi:ATP-binding cassette subfamily B protein